jgi:predicted RNA-binding protein with PIN domain
VLPNVHLIVDGYNVTKAGYGEQALADQRARLIGQLAGLAARAGAEVTVAFDGGRRPASQPVTPRGVRVLFSEGEIADDLIRRLVSAEPAGRPLIVVTSDQQIITDVTRAGAWTAPSAVLLALLG